MTYQTIDLPEVPSAEREGILDALYRFAAGQDLGDRALFESAFSEQAILDFSGPARLLGAHVDPFEGRELISRNVLAATGLLVTTHSVSNPRILRFDGERALLICLVEAHHLPNADRSRRLLLKNLYTVELVRERPRWVIDHMLIENLWMEGDPTILFSKQ